MPRINRRHFLQVAGSTLASIGLSQLDLVRQGNHYGRVLAQGRPGRKLALLVGINQYPDSVGSLNGCLTDIELQRELLVHRYGFHPRDILVVSDVERLKPDRATILAAFQAHLIDQAQPGDVIVFHFSGHGSLVKDPRPLDKLLVNQNGQLTQVENKDGLNGTLIPKDRYTDNVNTVQDIMGKTLFLMTYALKTDQVTVLLDSCHSGGGIRGNLRFRTVSSRQGDTGLSLPSEAEVELQNRLMADLGLSEETLQKLRHQGNAKGVAIGSAHYDQLAADAPFDNGSFHAGAFTYLLTRYLWQQSTNESIGTVFANLRRSARDISNRMVSQEPLIAANPAGNGEKPTYFLQPQVSFAEAVVRSVSPNGEIQYWLGGVSSINLSANQTGSIFGAIDGSGKEIAQIEQTQRRGLLATGRLRVGNLAAIQPGTLLREQVRGLPVDLKLRVGLDPSLGADLAVVKARLQPLSRIEVVDSTQSMNYRIGRMTAAYQTQVYQHAGIPLPAVGSMGLFTADLRPLTATFAAPGESAEAAIGRLHPPLMNFLAAEIIKAIGGEDGLQTRLARGLAVAVNAKGSTAHQIDSTRLAAGTNVQIAVKNTGDRPVFVAVLSIGDAGTLRTLFPWVETSEGQERLAVGASLDLGEVFTLGSPGLLEVMVLSSAEPLQDFLRAIKVIGAQQRGVSSSRGPAREAFNANDAINIAAALLGNIDQNTRSTRSTAVNQTVVAVDANRYGVTTKVIEVVPA